MAEREGVTVEGMIDRATRDHARKERQALTDHPTEEELVNYQEGQLGEDKEVALRRHLALCRDCADDLLELDDWESRVPSNPAHFPSSASIAVRRRALRERVAAGGGRIPDESAREAARWPKLMLRWPISASLAASLAIASLALGFWLGGLGSGERASPSPGPADRPFFFDLLPDGSTPRRSGAGQEIRVPAGMNPLVARLNLGDQTPYDEYRAEVVAPSGEVAWSQRELTRQPAGSFAVLIDIGELEPGPYRLLLVGRTGATEAGLAAYTFSLSHLPPE